MSSRLTNLLLFLLVLVLAADVAVEYRTLQFMEERFAGRPASLLDALWSPAESAPESLPLPDIEPLVGPVTDTEPLPAPMATTVPTPLPTPTPPPPAPAPAPPKVEPPRVIVPAPPAPEPEPLPAPTPVTTAPAPMPAPPAPESTDSWQTYGPAVIEVITHLLNGQYDPVVKQFDENMAQVLTRDGLAKAIDPFRQKHGTLSRLVSHMPVSDPAVPDSLHAFTVRVETEKDAGGLTFTVTLDDQKRIAGLYVQ